jgi:hypothetical protein
VSSLFPIVKEGDDGFALVCACPFGEIKMRRTAGLTWLASLLRALNEADATQKVLVYIVAFHHK